MPPVGLGMAAEAPGPLGVMDKRRGTCWEARDTVIYRRREEYLVDRETGIIRVGSSKAK